MNNQTSSNETIIFPQGEKITNNYFTGTAWLHMLLPNDTTLNCAVGNVTFEPCSKNNWHKHPGGQILLVTEGEGCYQEYGNPVQIIKKGDVVKVNPNVKHWHGATPYSSMTHIAITPNTQFGSVEWLEPVPEEEYATIKRP